MNELQLCNGNLIFIPWIFQLFDLLTKSANDGPFKSREEKVQPEDVYSVNASVRTRSEVSLLGADMPGW